MKGEERGNRCGGRWRERERDEGRGERESSLGQFFFL